jgi:hypothetical protein
MIRDGIANLSFGQRKRFPQPPPELSVSRKTRLPRSHVGARKPHRRVPDVNVLYHSLFESANFDHGIKAVKNLRRALGDSPDQPAYIETLPRLGYRLLVPFEWVDSAPSQASPDTKKANESGDEASDSPSKLGRGKLTGLEISHYHVLEMLGGGGMGVWRRIFLASPSERSPRFSVRRFPVSTPSLCDRPQFLALRPASIRGLVGA